MSDPKKSDLARAIRSYGNMSALARELGVRRQAVYCWYNGDTRPSPAHTVHLEQLTGVSREKLRPDIYAL